MSDVVMPKLSDTMEEGKILRWLKRKGDPIEAGEVLVEVETDKADMEVESTHSGTLREIRLSEGESAPVGAVIAVVDDGAADVESDATNGDRSGTRDQKPSDQKRSKVRTTERAAPRRASASDEEPATGRRDESSVADRAREDAGREGAQKADDRGESAGDGAEMDVAEPSGSPARGSSVTQEKAEVSRARAPSPAPRTGVRISPLARARAAELGVDLAKVRGTGPAGRVMRSDVEAQSSGEEGSPERESPVVPERDASQQSDSDGAGEAGAANESQGRKEAKSLERARTQGQRPAAGEPGSGTVKVRPPAPPTRPAAPSPTRARSGTSSAGASRRVPLTSMRASIARRMAESKREAPHFYVTSVVQMDLAVRLRTALKESGTAASGVTVNHLVLKATADALAAVPELNARFAGEAIEIMEEIHLGIATSIPDGLIVPVIHNADRLSLLEIAERARDLGEKARGRSFGGDDLSGATFTVSNLGMYGVDSFSAVINPPQAAILAVGAVQESAVVRNGALAIGQTMALTLSCDHRSVDGARAGEFLAEVRRRLENPTMLLFPSAREDS